MKLYATTTSERASKGQGGNEFIQIELMNEKKVIFGTIDVYPTDLYCFVQIHGKKEDFRLEQKGKSQECKHNWQAWNEDNEGEVFYCNKCEATKGKSQKGECHNANCNNTVNKKGMYYCEDHQD